MPARPSSADDALEHGGFVPCALTYAAAVPRIPPGQTKEHGL